MTDWETIKAFECEPWNLRRLYRTEKKNLTPEQIKYIKKIIPRDCRLIDIADKED